MAKYEGMLFNRSSPIIWVDSIM